MGESADPMYEELNAEIARLREAVASKDRQINKQGSEIIEAGNELRQAKLDYSSLVQETLKLSFDHNKTIQAVMKGLT